MKLHNLKPAEGSVKAPKKRLGRGQGSGKGGTSTKGHKGAQSRSGYSRKLGFEGGQMPLQRRIPKFGFKNPNKVTYKVLNLDLIQSLLEKTKTKEINLDFLQDIGFISKKDKVKVLGRGELKGTVNITAHAFSETAVKSIESKGGKVTKI